MGMLADMKSTKVVKKQTRKKFRCPRTFTVGINITQNIILSIVAGKNFPGMKKRDIRYIPFSFSIRNYLARKKMAHAANAYPTRCPADICFPPTIDSSNGAMATMATETVTTNAAVGMPG